MPKSVLRYIGIHLVSSGFKFNFFCNLLILARACISNSLNQIFYLHFLQKQNFMIFHQKTLYNSYSKAC